MKHILISILILIGTGIAAWWFFAPAYEYRFRLTYEVAIGESTVVASGVYEVKAWTQIIRIGDMSPYQTEAYGDAVILDLGERGKVIFTLAWGQGGMQSRLDSIAGEVFEARSGRDFAREYKYADEVRMLSADDIPVPVTFTDIDDPTTLQVVRPERFQTVFGEDVRFIGATLTVTRDPVTRSIGTYLPWINAENSVRAAAHLLNSSEGGPGPSSASLVFRQE